MSKLIYLDLLQMVTPGGDGLNPELFDFYVFGSFDALKVVDSRSILRQDGNICTIQDLHLISKERRRKVPAHFDKQPLNLYSPKDDAANIFRTDNTYSVLPLVLTLIQFHDRAIPPDTPDALVESFRTRLAECLNRGETGHVEFEVFFCLGEPDLAVAFRGARTEDIARLIYRIRLWEWDLPNGVKSPCVLSTSSHCGFPRADTHDQLKENIQRWEEVDTNVRFVTLLDTSYGLDNNEVEGSNPSGPKHRNILLGDWDHIIDWETCGDSSHFVDHIFKPVTSFDATKPGYFRTSFSMPVIGLNGTDQPYHASHRKLADLQQKPHTEEYEGENTQFSLLAGRIRELSDIYGHADTLKSLSGTVMSMESTLNGILKHLYQLKDGRFQYDLYSFLRPAFTLLPEITKNTKELIERFLVNYRSLSSREQLKLKDVYEKTVSILLDTYIHDTSRLLAELQHLFSVLSISPHTYLESYGSNMRSITAACKLLVAYQGIAYNLCNLYNMDLKKETGHSVQAQEVILVIPYRRIRQNTRVLFGVTSPESRIVYIRINASDMFHVQKTLFMLLHECGHHILNYDFREQRVAYYFRAYAGYLLDRAFDHYYKEPCIYMQRPLYSKAEVLMRKDSLQKFVIRYTSEDDISKALIESIVKDQELSLLFQEYWEKNYKKQSYVKCFAEPVSLCNHFLDYVKAAACSYMEDSLNKLEKGSETKNPLAMSLAAIMQRDLYKRLGAVIECEYQNCLYKNDSSLWHLTELRTIYQTYLEKNKDLKAFCGDEKIQKILQEIRLDYKSLYQGIADELSSVFRDIYSDLFAFSILGIPNLPDKKKILEAEKYIALLRDEAGFQQKQEFSKPSMITRILAVLEGCFGLLLNDDTAALLEKVLPLTLEQAKELVNETGKCVGFRYVREYVAFCLSMIKKQTEHLENEMGILRKMYQSAPEELGVDEGIGNERNLKDFVDAMYYYWKISSERV